MYGVKCLLVIKAINRLGAHLRLKSGIPRAIMVTLAGVIRAELCRGPPLNISLTGTMAASQAAKHCVRRPEPPNDTLVTD